MKFFYAAAILLCYGAFCWACWERYRRRQFVGEHADVEDCVVVAYASQSGQAAELARSTAQQLQEGKVAATVLPLNRLSGTALQRSRKILFLVSTYGEGEPPDMATRFAQRYLQRSEHDLSHLRYGVLALGDRQYQHFCGFGHRLCRGLQSQSAQPLFDLVEVDRQDPAALSLWQQRVVGLGGAQAIASNILPAHFSADLKQRRCLNKGSAGAAVYYLSFQPSQSVQWQAGDIACITPGNPLANVQSFMQELKLDGGEPVDCAEGVLPLEQVLVHRRLPESSGVLKGVELDELLKRLPPLPSRDYTIASIPATGAIELLVRQMYDREGRLGLGSGWLTQHAPLYSALQISIRNNPAFHATEPDTPLILIGNGTGMGGLRAHLLEREQCGAHANWLLFGERTAAHDLHFAEDIAAWRRSGHLRRFDATYSRDPGRYRYVQELLLANQHELLRWLDKGAAIYVCGSREGMAAGVDTVLRSILSAAELADLKQQGRYRRDVY